MNEYNIYEEEDDLEEDDVYEEEDDVEEDSAHTGHFLVSGFRRDPVPLVPGTDPQPGVICEECNGILGISCSCA